MGKKRPHSEVESGVGQSSDQAGPPIKKYKKHEKKKHSAKEGSMNWAKKRVRTIERRFQRDTDNIPQNIQKELERELASHQKRIAETQGKKRRHQMIKRYHMVRFFGMYLVAVPSTRSPS